jgi:hypothetical protein
MSANPIPVMSFRAVAIPAKNLQVIGKTCIYDRAKPRSISHRNTVTDSVILNMIDCQKPEVRLSATCTFTAVVLDYLPSDLLAPTCHRHVPSFSILRSSNPFRMTRCTFITFRRSSTRTAASTKPFVISLTFSNASLFGAFLTLSLPNTRNILQTCAAQPQGFTGFGPLLPSTCLNVFSFPHSSNIITVTNQSVTKVVAPSLSGKAVSIETESANRKRAPYDTARIANDSLVWRLCQQQLRRTFVRS